MARVWERSKHEGTSLLMLLAIADFADDAGHAYPAVRTLAAKCRCGERNTQTILARLRKSGELEIRANEGPKGTNLYRVVLAEGVQKTAPLKNSAPVQALSRGGAKAFAKGVQGAAPEPSLNHQEPSERATRSSKKRVRIPDDWRPDAKLIAWMKDARPDLNVETVTAAFRDYWLSKGEARADWTASFRLWVRREQSKPQARNSRHTGFQNLNYREGIGDDGSLT